MIVLSWKSMPNRPGTCSLPATYMMSTKEILGNNAAKVLTIYAKLCSISKIQCFLRLKFESNLFDSVKR